MGQTPPTPVPIGTGRFVKKWIAEELAEMIKYASNAFLAVKITFINEIANLCEKVGADVKAVATAMGKDGRIGAKFLHPGPGYRGSLSS
jgi:UDPglucose 6-dehydrogenase